jgi:hypothetical protein
MQGQSAPVPSQPAEQSDGRPVGTRHDYGQADQGIPLGGEAPSLAAREESLRGEGAAWSDQWKGRVESHYSGDPTSRRPRTDALALPPTLEGLPPFEAEKLLRRLDNWAEEQRREVRRKRTDPLSHSQPQRDAQHDTERGRAHSSPNPPRRVIPLTAQPSRNWGTQQPVPPSRVVGGTTAPGVPVRRAETIAPSGWIGETPSAAGVLDPLSEEAFERAQAILEEGRMLSGCAGQAPYSPHPYADASKGGGADSRRSVLRAASEASLPRAAVRALEGPSTATAAGADRGRAPSERKAEPYPSRAPSLPTMSVSSMTLARVPVPPPSLPPGLPTGSVGVKARLRAYTGEVEGDTWSAFAQHLSVVARVNRWDDEQTRQMFMSVLGGRALKYLDNMPASEGETLSLLLDSFKQEFAEVEHRSALLSDLQGRKQLPNETLKEVGNDIRRLVRKAYPTLNLEQQEDQMVMRFQEAIRSAHVQFQVKQRQFANLNALVAEAESVQKIGYDIYGEAKFSSSRAVAVKTVVEGEDTPMAAGKPAQSVSPIEPVALTQVKTLEGVMETRLAHFRDNANCYNCGKRGHLQYECLEPKREAPAGERYGRGMHWERNRVRAAKKTEERGSGRDTAEARGPRADGQSAPGNYTPRPQQGRGPPLGASQSVTGGEHASYQGNAQ